jgi:hypothetical protein
MGAIFKRFPYENDLKIKNRPYPKNFTLDFKIVFIKNFLKMASVRVPFSPVFLPGAGFSGEHVFLDF